MYVTGATLYYYMYAEMSYGEEGDIAEMSFSVADGMTCLTFHYSMLGEDVANLTVFTFNANQVRTELWSMYGDQSPHVVSSMNTFMSQVMNMNMKEYKALAYQWWVARVVLPTGTQAVSFQAVRGNGSQSDIAVDKVVFTSSCPIGGTVELYIIVIYVNIIQLD